MDNTNLSRTQSEIDQPTVREDDMILRPHHCLRNIYSPRWILVIASEDCLHVPDDLKTFKDSGVHVLYTKKMPLQDRKHPPIDAVVLICKLSSRDSLNTIKECLPYIDVRYFVGKCFILVTDEHIHGNETDEIEQFALKHHLPIHFASKVQDPGDIRPRLQIPSNIMAIFCPPAGSDVNSLTIEATMIKNGLRI